jgi:hypothetical protein
MNDYTRLSTTSAYLEELSADTGIPVTELLQVVQGGEPHLQGTWVHPQVSTHLAQWLSPKFAVQVPNGFKNGCQESTRRPSCHITLSATCSTSTRYRPVFFCIAGNDQQTYRSDGGARLPYARQHDAGYIAGEDVVQTPARQARDRHQLAGEIHPFIPGWAGSPGQPISSQIPR